MRKQFSDIFPLRNSRAHEVTGAGAVSFAMSVIARTSGPVIWIASQHQPERLHPGGMLQFCDPSRLIFSYGRTDLDLLWIAEEALRSGAAPVVVAQIQGDIDLTAGRRLQLAAEAGKALGLFLLPQGAGSNAAETRWECAPLYASGNDPESTLFSWQCMKNKAGTNGQWMVHWNDTTHRIDLVAAAGERTRPQAQAG